MSVLTGFGASFDTQTSFNFLVDEENEDLREENKKLL